MIVKWGGRAIFITRYYKGALVVLVIIVLVFIGYSQYEDKTMYEEYISVSVKNDMQELVNAIVDNQRIYKNILDEEFITKGDAYLLARNNGNVRELYQKFNSLANMLERIEHGETQNKTARIAQDISTFFSEMIRNESVDRSNLDEIQIELNSNSKQKIIKLKELNALWVNSVKNNVVGVTDKQGNLTFDTKQFRNHYGENSLSNDFWINLVLSVDKDTQQYLDANNLFDVENFLSN